MIPKSKKETRGRKPKAKAKVCSFKIQPETEPELMELLEYLNNKDKSLYFRTALKLAMKYPELFRELLPYEELQLSFDDLLIAK